LDIYLTSATTATAIQTTTVTTSIIGRTTKITSIPAEAGTERATKSGSDFHVSKMTLIILGVTIMSGLAIAVLWITRRLESRKRSFHGRRHLCNNFAEEIPISNPLEPSTLPFLQDYHVTN
jgi:hypothetical protein